MKQPEPPDEDRPLTRDDILRYKRAVYAVPTAEVFERMVAEQPADFRADFRRLAFPHLRNSVKIELRRRARERRAQATPRVH